MYARTPCVITSRDMVINTECHTKRPPFAAPPKGEVAGSIRNTSSRTVTSSDSRRVTRDNMLAARPGLKVT